jgi:amino acid adenylation domain-containing protein
MSETKITNENTGLEIAVIGMSCRFPGARNIEEFWANLKAGVESLAFLTEEEVAELEPQLKDNPAYVRAKGGVLEQKEYFDAFFFEYTPREAEILDPQARIFHEITWEALENAGYDPFTYEGLIALFAGASKNFNWEALTVVSGKTLQLGNYAVNHLIDRDFLSTRLAYKLNLKGPALSVQTGCSTSLVALHLACQSLLNGESDIALAGGVTIYTQKEIGYLYQQGMILSPDGHCRSFDAEAGGTVSGNGAGVVALKLLEESIKDKDTIHAVIKGSAINNDGAQRATFTAPSRDGQTNAIRLALQVAEVEPESITYVEAHGSGTLLGDPIEMQALTQAFDTSEKQYCAIGSVKTNVGHLDSASGITGFIKAVLAIKNRQIPPSLHFKRPNPKIDFENSPFYVNTELKEWKNNGSPIRAGVSSFGIGGTNAHVILEEAPPTPPGLKLGGESCIRPIHSCQPQLILLSAKTPTALETITQNLAQYLEQNGNSRIELGDLSYTLKVGRRGFNHRRMVVSSSIQELIEELKNPDSRKLFTRSTKEQNRPILFMFPGLGSQYVNMGRDLYEAEPVFREEMDRCFEILDKLEILDENIKEILFPHPDERAQRSGLSVCDAAPTSVGSPAISESAVREKNWTPTQTQVILFVFEYALAKALMKWGITPNALIGYSFGEYTAASISGVFTAEQALRLIARRTQLIEQLPQGAMLSVPLPKDQVSSELTESVTIAIDNGPSTIVAGTPEAVQAFEDKMKSKKRLCMKVNQTHALHTLLMEPVLKAFEQEVSQITLEEPRIPYISNVTGNWITKQQATDPNYWAQHMAQTVRFAEGVKELVKIPSAIFLEVGPGRDLSALVKRDLDDTTQQQALNTVRPAGQQDSDNRYLLQRIGQLWAIGGTIVWEKYDHHGSYGRIPLPTYPFERQKFWIEGDPFKMGMRLMARPKGHKNPRPTEWYYLPLWKQSYLERNTTGEQDKKETGKTWLLFQEETGIGEALVSTLRAEEKNDSIIVVTQGSKFQETGDNTYTIDPSQPEDYLTLVKKIETEPTHIIHLWGVEGPTKAIEGNSAEAQVQYHMEMGFYSLLNLIKALRKQKITQEMEIILITSQMQPVTGEETLCPGKAPALGLVKVVPQEYPHIRCRSIDIGSPNLNPGERCNVAERLKQELLSSSPDTVIAYRGTQRWVEDYESLGMKDAPKFSTPLREGGVYVITGGLGRIGRVFTRYLLKQYSARVILISRREPEALRIQEIQDIETNGGEILIKIADVSNETQMQTLIDEIQEQYGEIHGVIHAAGIIRGKSIRASIDDITREECQEQFGPKVRGTMVLSRLLKGINLDFFICISSLAPILGGLGFTAYSAANLFMDAYVKKHNQENQGHWLSVNWEGWRFEKAMKSLSTKTIRSGFDMTPQEGEQAFERILSWKVPGRIIISTGDLKHRVEQWISLKTQDPERKIETKTKENIHSRPMLTSDYIPPSNQIETKLTRIWQNFFGIDKVGTEDDFFEMGGDSLSAITVVSNIHKRLKVMIPLPVFFAKPNIRDLGEYVRQANTQKHTPIYSTEKKEYYPVSSSQRRLYLQQKLEGQTISYNITTVEQLKVQLQAQELEKAFKQLIQRHEILRTSFQMQGDDEAVVQRVYDQVEFKVDCFEEGTYGIRDRITEFVQPFDLEKSPLLRVAIIQSQEVQGNDLLIVDMHHILTDGVSMAIFVKEMVSLYMGESLEPVKLQYKDFSEWQQKTRDQQQVKEQQEYWLGLMEGEIPVLSLPLDFPRPAIQDFEGNRVRFVVEKQHMETLKEVALKQEVTLYMLLLSVYYVLLSRLSGQEDIIIGTPVVGRRHSDLQGIMGFFINMLVLRNKPAGETSFTEFLREIKENTLKAFENQEYPFEDLIDQLHVPRDMSRNPLFDVVFILQNADLRQGKLQPIEQPGIVMSPFEYEDHTSKFDLTLEAAEKSGQLCFELEYSARLFKRETIEQIAHYYVQILDEVQRKPGIRISRIEMIEPGERDYLLRELNATDQDYPKYKTMDQLLEEQAKHTPTHRAISQEGEALTYQQLETRAKQWAQELQVRGIQPDVPVGILMERSIDMIVRILGVLKSGGGYVPIDQEYPEERKKYMLKDSQVALLVTDEEEKEHQEKGYGIETVRKIKPENSNQPRQDIQLRKHPTHTCESMVYVIYTSGSTGRPKGVVIPHQGLVNYASWAARIYVGDQQMNFPLYTSISFDLTVTSIYVPLLTGNAIFVYPSEGQEPLITKVFQDNQVHIIKLTPSHLKMLQEEDIQGTGIRKLIVGGEALETALAREISRKFNGSIDIYNEYGPTETVVGCMIYKYQEETDTSEQVSIGRAVDNTRIYIVDKHHEPTPKGVLGEIYVSGDGVGRGYLNRVELTHDTFIPNPYKEGQKMYRTGDHARWLSDGNAGFVGRQDNQVKVRGYRIEMAEVEHALKSFEAVKEAVVLYRENSQGEGSLYGYVTTSEGFELAGLKNYLTEALPAYMVPTFLVTMDTFPLTSSGKLDRKQLLSHVSELSGDESHEYEPPANETETRLAALWTEVLGIGRIGSRSQFFEMGGNSLNAVRLVGKIHRAFDAKITLRDIFRYPTLTTQADVIHRTNKDQYRAIPAKEKREYYDLSYSQRRVWILSQVKEASLSFNIPMAYVLEGELNLRAFEEAFNQLVQRHESLRTVFITLEGTVKQRVVPFEEIGFHLNYIDLNDQAGQANNEQQDQVKVMVKHMASKERDIPFDLSKGPLLRATLLHQQDTTYVFLFTMHHIVSDLLSNKVLASEIFKLYNAGDQGQENPLNPMRVHYKDFAAWQNTQLQGANLERHRHYWMTQFEQTPPILELPIFKSRPEVQTYKGGTVSFVVEEAEVNALRKLGEQTGATLFMTLLSSLNILLHHYSGQEDLVIGVPIAGREHADLEDQIGMYLNTLALRTRIKPTDRITDYLEQVKRISLEGFEHQAYPFDKLVQELGGKRDLSRHPLFDVVLDMFNYTQAEKREIQSDLTIRPYFSGEARCKFYLVVYVGEMKNRLNVIFEYNTDVFEPESIKGMTGRFQLLLKSMLTDPLQQIQALDLNPELTYEILERQTYTEGSVKASYHQERLWFIDEFEAGNLYEASPIYHNIPLILEIEGPLVMEQLQESFNDLVKRHTALGTRIIDEENTLTQSFSINQNEIDTIEYIDLTLEKEGKIKKDSLELAVEWTKQPFNLEQGGLARAALMKTGESHHYLMIAIHHIVTDKLSLGIMVQELMENYGARIEQREPRLPENPKQYTDFCQWQGSFSTQLLDGLLYYWKRKLAGKLAPLELPTDTPRALIHTFNEGRRSFELPRELSKKIEEISQKEGIGKQKLLLGAFKLLLHKYTQQREILVGTSAQNREQAGMENLVGPVANLVVLRSFIHIEQTAREFFEELETTLDQAMKYQAMPFDPLVVELDPHKDMSRTALFDVLFQYEEEVMPVPTPKGLTLKIVETNLGWGKYDLNLLVRENQGQQKYQGHLVYNRDYFREDRMERLVHHYQVLLKGILENLDASISWLNILTSQEKQDLLREWNATQAYYPKEATMDQLVSEQANRFPGFTALKSQDIQVTYQEMMVQANAVACILAPNMKNIKHPLVCVITERSETMIFQLLGILLVGAAYVPIAPNYPSERIHYILRDSGIELLLADEALAGKIDHQYQGKVLSFEPGKPIKQKRKTTQKEIKTRKNDPQDPAYVIYTSGTTGRPKGCLVSHQNLVRLFKPEPNRFDFFEKDVWIMAHSYCFDFSVWEMYGALVNGGSLIIPQWDTVRDSAQFLQALRKEKVTVLNQTPLSFLHLVEQVKEASIKDLHSHLRYVIFGGDKLEPHQLKDWIQYYTLEEIKLINMYGITETTVHVTYYQLEQLDIGSPAKESPIGEPLPETQTYILDTHYHLVPIGVYGEIYVGGTGVCLGYLNRPELTTDRFIENPYKLGELLYKTGDLGLRTPQGEIHYIGRNDRQVKIRGYRIELGEIESRIQEHPSIKETVVILRQGENQDRTICAYVVLQGPMEISEIKAHLAGELPDYMIPAQVVVLENLPLTPNGKVDKSALPEPEKLALSDDYEAPRNAIEDTLAGIWSDLLGRSKSSISIHDNFFDLGGHSLKATLLLGRVHKTLEVKVPLAELFKRPQLKEISQYIQGLKRDRFEGICPTEGKDHYMLSSSQKRLYVLQAMNPEGTGYNMPEMFLLPQEPDIQGLTKAFKKLIQRHQSLRTGFNMWESEPVQRIPEQVEFEIEAYDIEKTPGIRQIFKLFIRAFDLSVAPLLRVGLIHRPGEKSILMVDMHHIISDGLSHEILVREYLALYFGKQLTPLKLQYKDYAEWQNREKSKGVIQSQEAYWLKQYSDEIPVLALPIDFSRPSTQSFSGSRVRFGLNRSETQVLEELAQAQGLTLFMVLLGAFTLWLSKLSAQEDIVVGTPVSGRRHADLEGIMGIFVNTLALRNYPRGEKTCQEYLQEVKNRTLEAFENQDYQFEDLVEQVTLNRDLSRNPLFDVMMVLQNLDIPATEETLKEESPVSLETYDYDREESKFDMTLYAVERDHEVGFALEYVNLLFEEETIIRYMEYYKRVLLNMAAHPETLLRKVELLGDREKKQVLEEFNQTEAPYLKDTLLQELFEQQVQKNKCHVALKERTRTGITEYTFDEFNKKTNQLARNLRSQGVTPNQPVAILVERSLEMMIGIYGILKAGGFYLPLDPQYPEKRIRYILEDSQAQILLGVDIEIESFHDNYEIVNLKETTLYRGSGRNITRNNQSTDLSYIIYTSGSTGEPKGVTISHHSVINRIKWMQKMYPLDKHDKILQKTAFTFDVSVWEIFWGGMEGAGLCLLESGGEKDPELMIKAIENQGVTVMHFVPSMLVLFLEQVKAGKQQHLLKSLKQMFCSGEKLESTHVESFNQLLWQTNGTLLANLYGPTEATVDVSYFDCQEEPGLKEIPIGMPIDNTKLYILDKDFQPQPIGIPGELCISGVGLSQGYLNNPELTGKTFITDTSLPGYRIYRTGDLARWKPDGNIEYLGRIDHQVKVRGFRIELGEIESQLIHHPLVQEAVALVKGDHLQDEIWAYIVLLKEIPIAELRNHLLGELPDYMVPSHFVELEKMPLTPSGKADRKKLSRMEKGAEVHGRAYVAPGDFLEMRIARIWSDVLKRPLAHISRDDNFFEIGGHSMKAITVISKLHQQLNVRVPMPDFFKHSRIRALSGYVRNLSEEEYLWIQPAEEREYYDLSSSQKRLYILQQMEVTSTHYNMPQAVLMEGDTDISKLEEACRRMIQRHESFRTRFEMVKGEPAQSIDKPDRIEFKIDNLNLEPSDKKDSLLRNFIKPFDLSKAPLLRVSILETMEQEHIFIIDMHHIISDGQSLNIFVREMVRLYNGDHLLSLRIQYKDFSQWQKNRVEKQGLLDTQETYWLSQFENEIPVLNLPLDHPRPQIQDFNGAHQAFELEESLTKGLKNLVTQEGATLYMGLLALFNVLLSRLSNQEDVVVGVPTAGRAQAETQAMIGMFVNTLALRNFPKADLGFEDFLAEIRDRTLKSFENQDYPFEDLVDKLVTQRDLSRSPLFDVMFVLQNTGETGTSQEQKTRLEGLKTRHHRMDTGQVKFDLSLSGFERKGKVLFSVSYRTSLFNPDTIKRIIGYYKNLTAFFIDQPKAFPGQAEILGEAERKKLIHEFNNTASDYPKDKTVHELFDQQAAESRDIISVISQESCLSYLELRNRASQIASRLREKGVFPGHVVGIMMDRSLEMITGIFGILKSGGAYLPLDLENPVSRKQYILKDSQAQVMVTKRALALQNQEVLRDYSEDHLLYLDQMKNIRNKESQRRELTIPRKFPRSENPAYVIYTSGTTGRPKGVMIEHANAVNLIFGLNEKIFKHYHQVLNISLTSAYVFDASVKSIFGSPVLGHCLCIVPEETRLDIHQLFDFYFNHKIDVADGTPAHISLFSGMLKEKNFQFRVKHLIIGGEELPKKNAERFFQQLEHSLFTLSNAYGPTECCVDTTLYQLGKEDLGLFQTIPIGQPLPNFQVYVLDRKKRIQPIGVPGELGVSGNSVGRGYLNRVELTSQKFISHPFLAGKRLYLTGDIVRRLSDGNIEYIGRIDHQVKVRGYRIELEEIQNQLLEIDDIKEAVVIVRSKNSETGEGEIKKDKHICAYMVSDKKFDLSKIKELLAKRLPAYMIPSYFFQLGKIPLTSIGKVDRNALPIGEEFRLKTEVTYVAPGNEKEKQIAQLWKEILKVEKVGIHDNFFDLGGNSLDVIKLNNRIKEEFKKEIPVVRMFEYPTIHTFYQYFTQQKEENQALKKELSSSKNRLKKTIKKMKTQ